ncbi:MAG: head GIN domain-containing protein [Aequorivita sp.]
MYTLAKTSFTLLFIFVGLQLSAQNNLSATIIGNRNMVTKTVNTKPYDIINIAGSMEVYLEKGKEGNITVTAEDNVQDRIIVESDGNTLTISMINNTSLQNTKKIKILIPFEAISEISLRGSGSVTGKDVLISNSLSLTTRGSGEIGISVKTDLLNAQLNGSGEIEISGTTKSIEVNSKGSGKFKGKELIADQAEINISGSGDSSIFVNNSLTGKIKGSGRIYYGGNPSINEIKVFGSGKVKSI